MWPKPFRFDFVFAFELLQQLRGWAFQDVSHIGAELCLFHFSWIVEIYAKTTKEMLDDMHKRKIDLADEIFVINVGDYIGDSTRSAQRTQIKAQRIRVFVFIFKKQNILKILPVSATK